MKYFTKDLRKPYFNTLEWARYETYHECGTLLILKQKLVTESASQDSFSINICGGSSLEVGATEELYLTACTVSTSEVFTTIRFRSSPRIQEALSPALVAFLEANILSLTGMPGILSLGSASIYLNGLRLLAPRIYSHRCSDRNRCVYIVKFASFLGPLDAAFIQKIGFGNQPKIQTISDTRSFLGEVLTELEKIILTENCYSIEDSESNNSAYRICREKLAQLDFRLRLAEGTNSVISPEINYFH